MQLLPSLLLLGVFIGSSPSSAFDLLTWGDKCQKRSSTGTAGECDQSVGLNCYTYSQGDYCGCNIDGPLSWDEKSKQCRRKPYVVCNYDPHPLLEEKLPFSQRCHTDASCLPANSTLVKTSHPPRQCFCNEGFKVESSAGQPWKCVPEKGGAASLRSAAAFVYISLALVVCSRWL